MKTGVVICYAVMFSGKVRIKEKIMLKEIKI